MKAKVISCGEPVNESERKALAHLRTRISSLPGDDEWVLLANVSFSVGHDQQSDEIDIIAVGPPGVRVIEVKHWRSDWIDREISKVEHEADKVTNKAKRVGTRLRKKIRAAGYVDGVFLITAEPRRVLNVNKIIHNIPIYTLKEWDKAIGSKDSSGNLARARLTPDQVRKLAKLIEPKATVPLDGKVRRLGHFEDLELQTPRDQRTHRIYKGVHVETRDRVVLHLYDLSANDEYDETKARREYEALHCVYKCDWAPRIRDSFQAMPDYPGEMCFFSIVDPTAPPLAKCISDKAWDTAARLEFAVAAIRAMRELHGTSPGKVPMLHRNLTPETILVAQDNAPILTGFELTRIPTDVTVNSLPFRLGAWKDVVAPEVRDAGLVGSDHRSDAYSLFASLAKIFAGRADEESKQALEVLQTFGMDEDPKHRYDLKEMEHDLEGLLDQLDSGSPVDEWEVGTMVKFRDREYRIAERLGDGGIGTAFKVFAVDETSGEDNGPYVGKVVRNSREGRQVRKNYVMARPHVARHKGLSAVFEVASEWRGGEFVALMTWVEGHALEELAGQFPTDVDKPGEPPEALALRWFQSACEALEVLHKQGLVHGDVSPRNIIVSNGDLVLTDYDVVSKIGERAFSPGTLKYCSPEREKRCPVAAADDIYALAASFFKAIFGRDPFNHEGVESKQKGLNWTSVDQAEFPRLTTFLDRATSPDMDQRYSDATAVLAAMKSTPSMDGKAPKRSGTPAAVPVDPTEEARGARASGIAAGSNVGANGDARFGNFSAARNRLVAWLRQQLIGPAPNAEERLVGVSPLERYPTGVLYPVVLGQSGFDPATPSETVEPTATELEDYDDETFEAGDGQRRELGRSARTRRYVPPSSVGFSCFIRGRARLQIAVGGTTYAGGAQRDGGRFSGLAFERTSLKETTLIWEDGTAFEQPSDSRFGVFVHTRSFQGGRVFTITLCNRQELQPNVQGSERSSQTVEKALFEAELECIVQEGTLTEYPRVDRNLLSDEDREIELQYRQKKIYAVGHGGAVEWDIDMYGLARVRTNFLPAVETRRMTMDIGGPGEEALDIALLASANAAVALPHVERFVAGYGNWIGEQANIGIPSDDKAPAERLRQRMVTALGRMQRGVELLRADRQVARAFQIANQAMLAQLRQHDIARGKDPADATYRWRPFQLAFLLAALESTASEDDEFRDVVDLIWFPTGGGKTEAYLGLVAFVISWRRLTYGAEGGGTAALMRYTLRLLTKQQFERAARMIFALELLRRERPKELGQSPITVGIWVGQATSPNHFRSACAAAAEIREGKAAPNGLVLSECPWCGTGFGADNYRADEQSFAFVCLSDRCDFGRGNSPLPCNVVDEALYLEPPSLLIATIDKFARLAWEGRATGFFGGRSARPPELVIQDELHLITGPLGSVAGIYEAGLETLLRARGGRPKYIASTATIRMAREQVRRLYGKDVRVFPPPGIDSDDCYFARADHASPGRLYLGFLSPMLDKRHCLAPLAAAALAGPELVFGGDAASDALLDAWWTQIVYHSSLASVGSSHNVYADLRRWSRWLVGETDQAKDNLDANLSSGRSMHPRIDQLTSMKSASENADTFTRLARRCDEEGFLDVVLATNMVSVGLDVDRLALMIINGQPYTSAEYIQASSRVGRSGVPGLVLVNYHRHQASSLFHYENFRPYHESFYRFVEPSSVTPYTYQVRTRALHASLVTACRHCSESLAENGGAQRFDSGDGRIRNVIETFRQRCQAAAELGDNQTSLHIDRLVEQWTAEVKRCAEERRGLKYDSGRDRAYDSLLRDFGGNGQGLWPTLNSMRDVERTAVLRVR